MFYYYYDFEYDLVLFVFVFVYLYLYLYLYLCLYLNFLFWEFLNFQRSIDGGKEKKKRRKEERRKERGNMDSDSDDISLDVDDDGDDDVDFFDSDAEDEDGGSEGDDGDMVRGSSASGKGSSGAGKRSNYKRTKDAFSKLIKEETSTSSAPSKAPVVQSVKPPIKNPRLIKGFKETAYERDMREAVPNKSTALRNASSIVLTEDQKRLLYLISLYSYSAKSDSERERCIRKTALMVLVFEGIVAHVFDYDYAPASVLVGTPPRRVFLNISQEGRDDMDDLAEQHLIKSVRLASKFGTTDSAYQLAPRGVEALAMVNRSSRSSVDAIAHDPKNREYLLEVEWREKEGLFLPSFSCRIRAPLRRDRRRGCVICLDSIHTVIAEAKVFEGTAARLFCPGKRSCRWLCINKGRDVRAHTSGLCSHAHGRVHSIWKQSNCCPQSKIGLERERPRGLF